MTVALPIRPLRAYADAATREPFGERRGTVVSLSGQGLVSHGPDAQLGEVCTVMGDDGAPRLRAEVVAVGADHLTLMPYSAVRGVARGDAIVASGGFAEVPVGAALLGRVVDAFGEPMDGRGPIRTALRRHVIGACPNPLERPPIQQPLETGIRAIDTLLTLGQGQRVGIFAGSGVGKSTLLGMLARHVRADVNVVALIGERGREVREFVERQLGEAGLRRSVVVAATSDQPALARFRAAHAATTMAEHFRDQGAQVLLMMDSVTRFAMARREIGLAAGEPPTARGYTPSVFAEIPALCERCGTAAGGGAITALYTVLVEGDDMNEPISDVLRSTLDGHIVLSRDLAHAGHYPAIDVLRSVSRLAADVSTPPERQAALQIVETLALLDRNRSLVDLGVYKSGQNPKLDRALALQEPLDAFLRQGRDDVVRKQAALAAAQQLLARTTSVAGPGEKK